MLRELSAVRESLSNVAPLWRYVAVSVFNVSANTYRFEMIKYVGFPAQILGESFRMMPVGPAMTFTSDLEKGPARAVAPFNKLTSCLAERRWNRTRYNTFCVGLDTQPAKVLILFWRILSVLLVRGVGRTVSFRANKNGSTLVPVICLVFVFSLIWVIIPSLCLYGHTIPLGFCIGALIYSVCKYVRESSYCDSRLAVVGRVHRFPFFSLFCMLSYAHYDEYHELMWPWWRGRHFSSPTCCSSSLEFESPPLWDQSHV